MAIGSMEVKNTVVMFQFVYEVCVNDMYTVQASVKMKMKTL